MLLGGLWHGAGWTFVIWGGLHGAYLMINHLWRALPFYSKVKSLPFYGFMSWLLTFIAVVVAWVYFRAESASSASNILSSMFGLYGIGVPERFADSLDFLPLLVFDGLFPNLSMGWPKAWMLIICGLICCTALPNVFELFNAKLTERGLNQKVVTWPSLVRFVWRPSFMWATAIALYLTAGLVSLSQPTEFLYFQF